MQNWDQLQRRAKLQFQIDHTNKEYLEDEPFHDISNLTVKLEKLKSAFLRHDPTSNGEIDYTSFHAMAQDLGIFRSVAALQERAQDVTGNTRNALSYRDCAMAMLGRRSTMCQRIMRYSGKNGNFENRPCWLDRIKPLYVSRLEVTLSPSLPSPITFLPPPPPPSPADMTTTESTRTYPAA
ncbi:allograft inflammatory factor 1-like isoform X2 [Dendrobates tinctorius]|uniref:allograft inflammatory factor 1-like isoform X2 n=1 Tax=Dendrobates tinctorius TaxID=92724 RepID=UPI003CC94B94